MNRESIQYSFTGALRGRNHYQRDPAYRLGLKYQRATQVMRRLMIRVVTILRDILRDRLQGVKREDMSIGDLRRR
jgi:hypothetical protein